MKALARFALLPATILLMVAFLALAARIAD